MYSLRRLQNRWEDAREAWKEGVREEGRKVLRAVEQQWGGVVREGGRRERKEEDITMGDVKRAREAVGRVRRVLERSDVKSS